MSWQVCKVCMTIIMADEYVCVALLQSHVGRVQNRPLCVTPMTRASSYAWCEITTVWAQDPAGGSLWGVRHARWRRREKNKLDVFVCLYGGQGTAAGGSYPALSHSTLQALITYRPDSSAWDKRCKPCLLFLPKLRRELYWPLTGWVFSPPLSIHSLFLFRVCPVWP